MVYVVSENGTLGVLHVGETRDSYLFLKGFMRLSQATNRRGFHIAECADLEACTACAACAIMCPDTAIEIVVEEHEADSAAK